MQLLTLPSQVSSLNFVFELRNRHFVTHMYSVLAGQMNDGSADITMMFYTITNCIRTFASKVSILSVLFHDSEFYL